MFNLTPLRATLAVLAWIVSTAVDAERVLLGVRAAVPVSALLESNDVVGSYLQTVGTIYAARDNIERKSNEVADLVRAARFASTAVFVKVQGWLAAPETTRRTIADEGHRRARARSYLVWADEVLDEAGLRTESTRTAPNAC
jgi:hypothetical protein